MGFRNRLGLIKNLASGYVQKVIEEEKAHRNSSEKPGMHYVANMMLRCIVGESCQLEHVVIGEQEHTLNVVNKKSQLYLDFVTEDGSSDYQLRINDKGVSFERSVSRSNHDHDDIESLHKVVDEKNAFGRKLGDLVWLSAGSSQQGYERFYVPFGSQKREG